MLALLLLTLLQASTPLPQAAMSLSPRSQATPAKPQTPPATTTPPVQTAKPPAPRPRPSGTATTTALLFITDGAGRFVEDVTVTVMGLVDRQVKSPFSGPTRVEGLRAGTYRVRFSHERFITFEKEIVWRAGTAAPELSITLNAAPPPPAPPPPPVPVVEAKPAPPKLPPPGQAKTISIPDYIERNFITNKEPQKESLIGCSGVGQAMLWQIRDPWNGRQHESADGMVYVVGGEGRLRLAEREFTISAGAFALVPRGTTYSLSRNGRNPLIVLAILAGAPCAAD